MDGSLEPHQRSVHCNQVRVFSKYHAHRWLRSGCGVGWKNGHGESAWWNKGRGLKTCLCVDVGWSPSPWSSRLRVTGRNPVLCDKRHWLNKKYSAGSNSTGNRNCGQNGVEDGWICCCSRGSC